eukprot:CAMPEP_0198118798 /NCGR_PEP_ID=MMETSP1442-20131203/23140_1 /TAXON_ID= /ORGANISM="Craspedostauros australis, Strain CCMP3328" /LENGTH=42 /DNA_ID= /DNA_START= /DNA_END= /DNA_ORIENTATION=
MSMIINTTPSRLPSSEKDEKAIAIEQCLNRDPLDLWHLRELA